MAGKAEVAKKDAFSTALMESLNEQKAALPSDFNVTRFVQNSVALLNGNEVLMDFAKKNPTGIAQIKAGLMRGAFLGLDALNQEMYLVPYGSTLNFMASYKGMVKMATKYATRPIKSIYAKVVREGDEFQEVIIGGEPSINFKPKPTSTPRWQKRPFCADCQSIFLSIWMQGRRKCLKPGQRWRQTRRNWLIVRLPRTATVKSLWSKVTLSRTFRSSEVGK